MKAVSLVSVGKLSDGPKVDPEDRLHSAGRMRLVSVTAPPKPEGIHPAVAACRSMRFVSKASAAESFLSRCGIKRRAPDCSSHASPLAAPQVVQRAEFICFTVSSLVFIQPASSCSGDASTDRKKPSRSVRVVSLLKTFLESALDFFGVKQFPQLTGTCPRG